MSSVLLIFFLMAAPPGTPQAQTDGDPTETSTAANTATASATATSTPYELPTKTPHVSYDPYSGPNARPTPSNTAAPTSTPEPEEDDDPAPAAAPREAAPTSTRTPTNTHTPEPDDTNTPTPTPREESQEDTATPTITGTPTPTPREDFLVCPRGVVTLIEGEAPPDRSLVLFFGGHPAGGGTSTSTGEYVIPLTVGPERSGEYLVQVKTRHTRLLVRELICQVPEPTPGLMP